MSEEPRVNYFSVYTYLGLANYFEENVLEEIDIQHIESGSYCTLKWSKSEGICGAPGIAVYSEGLGIFAVIPEFFTWLSNAPQTGVKAVTEKLLSMGFKSSINPSDVVKEGDLVEVIESGIRLFVAGVDEADGYVRLSYVSPSDRLLNQGREAMEFHDVIGGAQLDEIRRIQKGYQ